KAAVTPAGSPAALSVTRPEKPLTAAVVTVAEPLWPAVTLTVVLSSVNVKSGWAAAVTLSVAPTVWESVPLVPVMVNANDPVDVDVAAEPARVAPDDAVPETVPIVSQGSRARL